MSDPGLYSIPTNSVFYIHQQKKRTCNCKHSRCTKLYCECFAAGMYCGEGCNCVSCCNNAKNERIRTEAVESTLERNTAAFRPKIAGSNATRKRHNKGCNCRKSGCLKKYCECFQAGITCGDSCKCKGCKNLERAPERAALLLSMRRGKRARIEARAAAAGAAFSSMRGPEVSGTLDETMLTDMTKRIIVAATATREQPLKDGIDVALVTPNEENAILSHLLRCVQQVVKRSQSRPSAPAAGAAAGGHIDIMAGSSEEDDDGEDEDMSESDMHDDDDDGAEEDGSTESD